MELTPIPPSSELSQANKTDFFIQSDQEGLFFGLEFLECFLKSDDPLNTPKITAYCQDGECIFKGQTLLRINFKNQDCKKEDLLSIVSYLSGAYTLISCWTERNFDFSIIAGPTPDFAFSDWEEKAILKAGAVIGQCPHSVYFDSKDVHEALKRGEKEIVLSCLKMSKEEIKSILQCLPHFVKCSLQGAFFPSDLEEFRDLNLTSVYPDSLQGFFPRLKMVYDKNNCSLD